jgi:hypothetical protein
MARHLRRALFRSCMTVLMPLIRAQARLARAVHAQRRMEGSGAYLLPLTLPATLACWAPVRMAAVGVLWLAVAAAGGADARAID